MPFPKASLSALSAIQRPSELNALPNCLSKCNQTLSYAILYRTLLVPIGV
jgi:hypothetical protein